LANLFGYDPSDLRLAMAESVHGDTSGEVKVLPVLNVPNI
jgi:hypothetical protein